MQNSRSWESGSQSDRRCMSTRKWPLDPLLTLVRAFTPEAIMLPRNRVGAAAWSLQAVYDLAAKRRGGLRFNCKNLASKCASLRFTCNRQQVRNPTLAAEPTL